MKTKLVFLLYSAFFCLQMQGNINKDSLVKINDLTFKNLLEKSAFYDYSHDKDSTSCLNLFLTSYDSEKEYDSEKATKKINDCILFLQKEISGKSDSKKIKLIYNYVHKTFFRVYQLKNSFSSIFEKGEYNCVSASAIYAIIFTKLSIPYQIMESPEHVYIIAYPNTSKILIETTSPENGYFIFNNDFATKYITHLVNSKIISKQEFDTTDISTLFNKYYFSSTSITLVQLAGDQYSNFAVYDFENKNYERSIPNLKKAFFLNPSDRNKFLLKSALSYQLSNSNYSDKKQVENLSFLCRFNNKKDEEISNEFIKNEFLKIIQDQLINNSDFSTFDESHSIIKDNLIDTSLIREIDFSYHYELARLGFLNFKDQEYQFNHFTQAYLINPNNANLQSMILGYFGNQVQKNNEVKSIVKLMTNYETKFSFLSKNDQFNNIKANCLLELSYQNFILNNTSIGEQYLKDFEKLSLNFKTIVPSSIFVEKAYSSAASFFYKKGDIQKSKQLLKKGLIFAPENFGLKQRLLSIN